MAVVVHCPMQTAEGKEGSYRMSRVEGVAYQQMDSQIPRETVTKKAHKMQKRKKTIPAVSKVCNNMIPKREGGVGTSHNPGKRHGAPSME